MVRKLDQSGLRSLLAESIVVLCKNGLQYDVRFTIQGLLGITVDDGEVLLVDIHEKVGDDVQGQSSSPDPAQTDETLKHTGARAQKRPHGRASWSRTKVARSEISQDRNMPVVSQSGQVVNQTDLQSGQVISPTRQDEQLQPCSSQSRNANESNSYSVGTGFSSTEKDEECGLEMNVIDIGLEQEHHEMEQIEKWASESEKQSVNNSAHSVWPKSDKNQMHQTNVIKPEEQDLILVKEEVLEHVNIQPKQTENFQPFTSPQSMQGRQGEAPSFNASPGTTPWGGGVEGPSQGLESIQQITLADDDLAGFINQTSPVSHNFITPSQHRHYNPRPRQGYVSAEEADKYGMVELVPGMGVFVYPEDLTEATVALNRKPGRKNNKERVPEGPNGGAMARVLLKKFYSTADLVGATISLKPTSPKKALDPTIVEAILAHCIKNCSWPRYKLRDVLFSCCTSATSIAMKKQQSEGLQPPASKT